MRTDSKRIRLTFLALALCASGLSVNAQTQNFNGDVVRELHPKSTPSPFPLDGHGSAAPALDFRDPGQMTAADRQLADASQAEIARRASLQGFGSAFARTTAEEETAGKGDWGYEQAVCPVFPDYLILEYSRIETPGVVTLFSVSIPRSTANGHVRVIPVRRRGYSLWTPAPSNALTLNDFNHMVAEGGHGVSPDWLTLGLCYAALAGGHVRAALAAATREDEVYPLFLPARLAVSQRGGAEVDFADVSHYSDAKAKAMEWVLTFGPSGHLMKVRHSVADAVQARPLPATVAEKAVPVQGAAIDLSKPQN